MAKYEQSKPYDGIFRSSILGLGYLGLMSGVNQYQDDALSFSDAYNQADLAAAAVVKGDFALRGEELRYIRKHLGFTQEQIGAVIGTKRETVNRWEASALRRPEKGGRVPEDKPIPVWADRAVRLYAAATMGLADMGALLGDSSFGTRTQGERSLLLSYETGHWAIFENSLAPAGSAAQVDPLKDRRLVCRLMKGDAWAHPDEKEVIARLEAMTVEEAATKAAAEARGAGVKKWHLWNHLGLIIAHNDPEVSHIPPTLL